MSKSKRPADPSPEVRPSGHPIVSLSRRVHLLLYRQRSILRSWLVFLMLLMGMHLLLDWSGPRVWDFLDTSTARMTSWALSILGIDAHAQGKDVISSIFTLRIIRECTAVHPVMIYVAAVFAYPCAWLPRLVGAAAGTVGLLLVNQVRLVSLCFVGHSYPESFENAHMLVGQSLIIFVTVLFWIVWASMVIPKHDSRAA